MSKFGGIRILLTVRPCNAENVYPPQEQSSWSGLHHRLIIIGRRSSKIDPSRRRRILLFGEMSRGRKRERRKERKEGRKKGKKGERKKGRKKKRGKNGLTVENSHLYLIVLPSPRGSRFIIALVPLAFHFSRNFSFRFRLTAQLGYTTRYWKRKRERERKKEGKKTIGGRLDGQSPVGEVFSGQERERH